MRGETIATAASKAKSNQYSGIMQFRSREVVRLWPLKSLKWRQRLFIFTYKQAEAKQKVIAAKGDPNNVEWVLAMTNLQFGKYRVAYSSAYSSDLEALYAAKRAELHVKWDKVSICQG
ncbi:Hypothetical predicted protein, partial [Paramuricea clavata]